ncbi:MAG: ketoacyl-ACP synthase III [Kofleriaceae bacterium]|jgi:3-oxoacyl-[acyl-carrier-protein] synthase-3|nr:ketoacyl-ACP synthase III [Kofleriaceae bacterium]MBP9204999.1 ketoacyl-ACP synthase III [Kofleriaceae bacterium]
MIRAQILGLGSYVPDRVVTNDDLRFFDDKHVRQDTVQTETNDEWIRQRSGIETRRYVPNDGSTKTSDLALQASRRALADAGVDAKEVDCIVLATLSPDIHFPGTAVFLQDKLGIAGEGKGKSCACYDIRQQCSGFVYALQMADAFIRAGLYKRVLVVGAEIHSHSMDYSTRGRDVMVLFGDGAGAVVLGPVETDDPRAGVMYTQCGADGTGAWNLYIKVFEIEKLPFVQLDPKDRDKNLDMYPQMDGKRVFLNAVRTMVMSTNRALAEAKMTWGDIDWFVPHQANLRINEKVVEVAGIPADKVLNTIQFYGNTTAATVPLTIDYWRQQGKVKKGDRVLATVFGAGFTWGSAIFQV